MGRPRLFANATERQRAHRQKVRTPLQPPCVEISPTCRLYHGDARIIAPTLRGIDALITDPPYGTNFDFTNPRRSRPPLQPCSIPPARWTANVIGDAQPFDPTPWLGYPQIILWGANHYYPRLPAAGSWLVWNKRGDLPSNDFGDGEAAWTNVPVPFRIHTQLWNGIIRAGEANVSRRPKYHPCEKPIELMLWCVAMTSGTVLDPYAGSGSTGAACVRLGRTFIGIEVDAHYFKVACDRLQDEVDRLQAACA
jgi:hypothetical protein